MDDYQETHGSISHTSFNGKLMISSVALLFVACFTIVLFHVCIRCFRRRPDRRLRLDTAASPRRGLDISAMSSLPTFVYKSESRANGQENPPECAVCLSEFEGGETGRILPECKHRFHVDCIDMWLQSHCVCPLCRTLVTTRPVKNPVRAENRRETIVPVIQDTGSGLLPACRSDAVPGGCSSSSPPRTADVLKQSAKDPDPNPDIESGLKKEFF